MTILNKIPALAVLALACVLLGVAPGAGQDADSASSPPESAGRIDSQFVETLENQEPVIKGPVAGAATAETGADARSDTGLMPELIDTDYLDEAGIAAMRQSLKAFYDYKTRGFEHRSRVFEWQLLSSRMIFGLVIAIVAIGLYFSWLQFMAGLREGSGADRTVTTFEASTTGGLKVSSPVLGIIILALSLAFLYLYLVHVYPIEEIF